MGQLSCLSCDSSFTSQFFRELHSFRNGIVLQVSQLQESENIKMLKLIVTLFCLSVAFGVGNSTTTTVAPTKASATTPPTSSINISTTAHPTGNSSTTTPQPTKNATNASTTAKPTTTPQPTKNTTNHTSTPKPTTTPQPTKNTTNGSTTAKPTTTPKPTTTIKPTTKPPPHGNFSLFDNKTKKYCLLAEFAVDFDIKYMKEEYKDNASKIVTPATGKISLGRTNEHDVKIDGDCGTDKKGSKLILIWPKNESYYVLTMEFSKEVKALEASDKNTTSWKVNMISLQVQMEGNKDFPNATEKSITSTYNGSDVPYGGQGDYYTCESKQDLKFKTGPTNYSVDAAFQDLKVEPFVAKNHSDDFGKNAKQCLQDKPTTNPPTTEAPDNNDIVPIAVGCALAGLVLIVLIAYIIGRRKSHRGYEKV